MSPIAMDREAVAPTRTVPKLRRGALSHIPGSDGWPLIGTTLQFLADPKGAVERNAAKYGSVYRSHSFGHAMVSLLGPDANQFVLSDQASVFSSEHGWSPYFGRLFPRSLVLRDFEEHRLHRKALGAAFKPHALQSYLNGFNCGMSAVMAEWVKSPHLRVYPAIKAMSLDLAALAFLGVEIGSDLGGVKKALIDMIAASMAVVRLPVPGTKMSRGLKGRQYMVDYFGRQVAARRDSDGEDIFTQLCKASTDDGRLLSTQDIIDHMNFLIMAGHDTLASTLTSFVYFLAINPEWQRKLRDEALSLALVRGEPLLHERLAGMKLTEMAIKETLRLMPPVPSIPRRAVRDTEFAGLRIPAGAGVNIHPLHTHRMAEIWPDPTTFDPMRFTEDAARLRHRYAFVPFGGGAHLCIGQQLAYMEAKCFAYHLLTSAEISVPCDYQPEWSFYPVPKPRDGLQLTLKPLP